jgi:hypothetical protein
VEGDELLDEDEEELLDEEDELDDDDELLLDEEELELLEDEDEDGGELLEELGGWLLLEELGGCELDEDGGGWLLLEEGGLEEDEDEGIKAEVADEEFRPGNQDPTQFKAAAWVELAPHRGRDRCPGPYGRRGIRPPRSCRQTAPPNRRGW